MSALADQFCPNVHDHPITAAAFDQTSGTLATADSSGLLAIQRRGEFSPGVQVHTLAPMGSALAVIPGGSLVALGNLHGSVFVYDSQTGEPTFQEQRSGSRGRIRAMHGIAISPEGTRLAAIAADGLLRLWDLTRGRREVAWKGFGGSSIYFDPRGERLLCLDSNGQVRIIDLLTSTSLPMAHLQMNAKRVCFSSDGTMVIALAALGISLLRVVDGQMLTSFAARGGSGLLNLALSPDGSQVAAITQRSVHRFSLPALDPLGSTRHRAPHPSGAIVWTEKGVLVAGSDGLLHNQGSGALGQVQVLAGYGGHRILAHGATGAHWYEGKLKRVFKLAHSPSLLSIDRAGWLAASVSPDHAVAVYDLQEGRPLFRAGAETVGATTLAIGGHVVAVQLASGGCRWWHLKINKVFDLPWVRGFALSGSGTWLAVITPGGAVRILDPASGEDAIPRPETPAAEPAILMAFIDRKAQLLVLDRQGNLLHFDLRTSTNSGLPSQPSTVFRAEGRAEAIWGVPDRPFCVIRTPGETPSTCTMTVIDIPARQVASRLVGLAHGTNVDSEQGVILEPVRSSAVLERELDGREKLVVRSLPDDQWISFNTNGLIGTSPGAGAVFSR